ncbi:MAG TPA: ThuA domain-containing protein [Candidatus Acidoferrum sp.]|nr:ThuA domain-containing protein [Candidatus Acidoferrum sp.]
MKNLLVSLALFVVAVAVNAQDWVTYEGKSGDGRGKHIVLLAGDEEYRSEEAMPMLAKVLSQNHGFTCSVLFSVNATNGIIDPTAGASLAHPEALDTADAIVMLLRFRRWNDDALKKFDAAMQRGVPIIALRTSTHAFNGIPKESPYAKWNYGNQGGFGKQVLGETWVTHWGNHKKEATRGVVEPSAKDHAVLRGVMDIFGDSDVYEAAPPADAKILVRGQVLKGMKPTDEPADYKKKNAAKEEQGVNDPAMPIAWTREVKNDNGKVNRIFCTTMGSASDLPNEGLRRLVVNAVFWGLRFDVPQKADVTIPGGEFRPTMYGFNGHQKGLKPSDFTLDAPIPPKRGEGK